MRRPRSQAPAGPEIPAENLDVMPRPLKQVPPVYPAALREFGISGRVVVSFVIGSDGDIADAKVRSSTHSAFEEPALAGLAEWEFAPGQKAGAAVNTRVEMALVFTMQREAADWF